MRPRRRRVLAPLDGVADVEVPHVDELVHVLDELEPLAVLADTTVAETERQFERVDPESDRDGAVVSDGLADQLEHLAAEPNPILERAPVLIGPPVEEGEQELVKQRLRVGVVDREDVEAGIAGPLAGVHVQLLDLADVVSVHLLAGAHERERTADLGRAARGDSALHAAGVGPAVPDLDRCERALLMDHVAHEAQVGDVALVPEPGADAVRIVRLRRDRAVLGRHGSPAALGLHGAEVRLEAGPVGAGTVAVRRLEEAVGQGLRADLERLEQDVVLGIARHLSYLSSLGLPSASRLRSRGW